MDGASAIHFRAENSILVLALRKFLCFDDNFHCCSKLESEVFEHESLTVLSSYKAIVVGCPFTWNCWTAEAG